MTLLFLFVLAQGPWRGFAATDASHEDSPCPSGWILAPQGLGCVLLQVAAKVPQAWYLARKLDSTLIKCVLIWQTEALTWVDASESCWKNHQAHLAEIKSEEQRDFIR